jgi:hypothetical protein
MARYHDLKSASGQVVVCAKLRPGVERVGGAQAIGFLAEKQKNLPDVSLLQHAGKFTRENRFYARKRRQSLPR